MKKEIKEKIGKRKGKGRGKKKKRKRKKRTEKKKRKRKRKRKEKEEKRKGKEEKEKRKRKGKLTSTFSPCSSGIGAWTTGTGATNPFLFGPSTCCENVILGQQL